MAFRFRPLDIPDVLVVEPGAVEDHRGLFMEVYKYSAFSAGGIPTQFVQDNCSTSRHRVLRGLHYQRPPKAQAKLVMVLQGEIFDVAVDLREQSPSHGRWAAVTLSAANRRMLYIPEGFAHGFCVLSHDARVLYKVTAEYDVQLEGGIRWDDPELAIRWPVVNPVLSKRDSTLPFFHRAVGQAPPAEVLR